jgi:hypothetical protein
MAGVYTVDCVPLQELVLSRAGKVQVRYLVHWSGYSAEQATWEPRCNLDPDTITVDVEPSLRSIDRPPHEKLKKYGIYTVMSHTSTGRSITRYMLGRSVPLPRHTAVQVALWPIGQIYSCSTAVDTAVCKPHGPFPIRTAVHSCKGILTEGGRDETYIAPTEVSLHGGA